MECQSGTVYDFLIAANQYYKFGVRKECSFEVDELVDQFKRSTLRDYACGWILYALKLTNYNIILDEKILAEVYLLAIENKRLKRRYYCKELIKYLESGLSTCTDQKVRFYL